MTINFHLSESIDNYAVMGNPIAHSLSPSIHHEFAKQKGIRLNYQAILVEPEDLSEALSEFQKGGGKGLNITVPFKQEAYKWVNKATAKAEKAGAVNTVWFADNGESYGDTTDGVGLLNDLRRQAITINGKRVLVLGAGGAVRSVLSDLLAENPEQLTIANRTISCTESLLDIFSEFSCLNVEEFTDLSRQTYDLVINGTSASLQGELPPLPDGLLRDGGACYDMVYAKEDTAFVSWGKEHGAKISVDGLGMLVEQAAESFYIWHGVRPEADAVITQLRSI